MSEQEGGVVLVGTSHVSERSVEEVESAIDEEEPDVVAVELDEKRYKSIKGDGPDDLSPQDLIQGSKPFELLIYWLLSYLQTKMGDRFGIEPVESESVPCRDVTGVEVGGPVVVFDDGGA